MHTPQLGGVGRHDERGPNPTQSSFTRATETRSGSKQVCYVLKNRTHTAHIVVLHGVLVEQTKRRSRGMGEIDPPPPRIFVQLARSPFTRAAEL